MKKAKNKKAVVKKRSSSTKRVSVVIDKKLDSLSNRILFEKKLEKANRILSGVGVPA